MDRSTGRPDIGQAPDLIEHSRYRVENGEASVDVRIAKIEQLIDNRDPAPFRERDLDPDLVEYLLDAVRVGNGPAKSA